MNKRFQELIEQLGTALDLPLNVDRHGSCSILFDEQIAIYIEPSKQDQILLGSFICPLPPGKFRETVLLSALKANHVLYPRIGVLSFSEKENKLAIHKDILIENTTGDIIADHIAEFVAVCLEWRNSIETQNIAPPMPDDKLDGPPPPFGIKP